MKLPHPLLAARFVIVVVTTVALSSTLCVAKAAPATHDRPNLIAIVTDDQGRWAMGAYGNDDIHTPALDSIAADGALFTEAFVATPVCSPSRATYLTGRYPTELGITDWINPDEAADGLGLAAATWPQVLQAHGYRTALIGKWHLGVQPPFHPTRLGFDEFMGFLSGGNRPVNPLLEVDGKDVQLEGPLPDLLVDRSIEFVEAHRNVPFALCLHFRAPHLPYGPVPAADTAHYDGVDPVLPRSPGADRAKLKQSTLAYYGSISSVDRNVGRLLEAIDRLELAENTIVVFTSDHGYNEGRHSINTKGNGHWIAGGIRGPKRPNMWDTSIRVPLAIRWPAVIRAGTVIDATVSNVDMYRTALGMVGAPTPDDCAAHGRDFSPILRGESLPPRPEIYGQYDLHNGGLAYLRMIRTDRYKFVRHHKSNYMDELYDLQADPGEEKNLINRRGAGSLREVHADLAARLSAWQASIDDPVLESSY